MREQDPQDMARRAAPSPCSKLLILVVEDDPQIREILLQTLAPLGCRLRAENDGQAAIAACKEELPALVLTDLMMPHVDGMGLLRWLRTEYPDQFIPVLMLTALGESEQKVGGLRGGADDYLTKPFHHKELLARAEGLLRLKLLTERLKERSAQLEALNGRLSLVQEELVRRERRLVATQLAGTCAHNLGQPVTSILLNCRMLEKTFEAQETLDVAQANQALSAIKEECHQVQHILRQLIEVDADATRPYLGEMQILELAASPNDAAAIKPTAGS